MDSWSARIVAFGAIVPMAPCVRDDEFRHELILPELPRGLTIVRTLF
jgi:hypothetical protein